MRSLIFTLAAAASALVIASPASAQLRPPAHYGYGAPAYGAPSYGAPYGNAYGYNQNRAPYGNAYGYNQHGGIQRWAQQLNQFRNDVYRLSRSGRFTRAEHRQSMRNIDVVERALRKYSRNGITQREAWDLDRRMANLQRSIMRSANDNDGRQQRRWR